MFSVMDDDVDEKSDTKRKTRNLSEKKRRDQFNTLVNELSAMVSATSRKMDKATVLRSTINFLKNYNETSIRSKVHDIDEDWKPAFLSNEEFMHLILEAFVGFIVVFSSSGRILYTSGNITSLLGYLPSDVLNMSIYDMMLEEEHSDLHNLLTNPPTVIDLVQESLSTENQVCFRCHLKRGGLNYRDVVVYEHVQFTGYFRSEEMDEREEEDMSDINVEDSKRIFVGTTRIQMPKLIREMSINGTKKSEFTSRHSLEWKFLFLDHRAPPIIGYLPIDVLGTSGYDYYHFDDLEQVAQCHEALKHKGEGTSCYYRFLTKGQQWLWLQTRYYITYHQWTSKPEFVVCSHRVINYVDVVQQMRRNNGRVADGEDNSSDSVERKLNTSAKSMMITSPGSSQSSRSRMGARPSTAGVSNYSHRCNAYHPPSVAESTYTDMSGSQQHIESDSSLPIKSSPQHQTTPPTSIPTSSVSMQSFNNEVSQFVATYTVPGDEPITTTQYETPNNTVTANTVPRILLQDQQQCKQEDLQLIIGNQHDEMRRVSQQLVMARFGEATVCGGGPPPDGPAQMMSSMASVVDRYSPDSQSERSSVTGIECHKTVHQKPNQLHQHHQHHLHHHQQQQQQHQQHHHQQQTQQHDQQPLAASALDIAGGGEEVLSYMQLQPASTAYLYTHHRTLHSQQTHQQPPNDSMDNLNPPRHDANRQ